MVNTVKLRVKGAEGIITRVHFLEYIEENNSFYVTLDSENVPLFSENDDWIIISRPLRNREFKFKYQVAKKCPIPNIYSKGQLFVELIASTVLEFNTNKVYR